MQTRNRGDYTIAGCELVAEGADLRVQVLSLAAGQCVPWHYHSEINDSFVCLEGPMVVETRAPRHVYRLLPGERCAVPPKTAHYVHGEADGPCKFLIVQGVGVTAVTSRKKRPARSVPACAADPRIARLRASLRQPCQLQPA